MKDLIAKLEAAAEGSIELDQAIGAALDLWPIDAYTRSLDDALTLVPEGWAWKTWAVNVEGEMECGAAVNFERKAHAPTPALALCIAALRARSAT
jgi:hypothetical protein